MKDGRLEFIERLRSRILDRYRCDAVWQKTVPVIEEYRGQTIWDGDVEVFEANHPDARLAFAWSDLDEEITTVLGVAPATDAVRAVQFSVVSMARKRRIADPRKPDVFLNVKYPPDIPQVPS